MDNQSSTLLSVFLILTFSSMAVGVYLISDYYMDEGFPSAFGMACNMAIQDDCLYVNSHFSFFGVNNYDGDNDCTLVLDAGKQAGARYKLSWKRFRLEYSENCTNDYLALYDTDLTGLDNLTEYRYCGKEFPTLDFNFTQQYITVKFRSDSSDEAKGFRVMATRTLPAPCQDGYFLCKSENRCIDGRLECDGTPQCEDRTDENDCNFWEKLIGGLLALGVAGMVGMFFIIICGCTSVCVTYCICKKCCCKRRNRKVGDVKQSSKKTKKQNQKKRDEERHEEMSDENQNETYFTERSIVAVPDMTYQSTGSKDINRDALETEGERTQQRQATFIDQTEKGATANGKPWTEQANHYQGRELPSQPGHDLDLERQKSQVSFGEEKRHGMPDVAQI